VRICLRAALAIELFTTYYTRFLAMEDDFVRISVLAIVFIHHSSNTFLLHHTSFVIPSNPHKSSESH
jgi:hypothetical protein